MLRCGLATLSLVLALGLLEVPVLAGLVDYRLLFSVGIDYPWDHPENVLDTELFHIHKPYLQIGPETVGGDEIGLAGSRPETMVVDYKCDGSGFRNTRDYERADLAMIGDSFLEASTIGTEDLVTTVLSRDTGLTVVNLGQSWYGPQQELIVLRRFALPLRPSIVVWAFFEGNDLEDIQRYRQAVGNWQHFSSELQAFRKRTFARNSILKLTYFLEPRMTIEEGRRYSAYFSGSSKGDTRIYFSYRSGPLGKRDEEGIGLFGETLNEAARLCERGAIQLMVVFIPTKMRVFRDFVRFEEGSFLEGVELNDLPLRVARLVRENAPEASYLDLTSSLRASASEGMFPYFATDSHWSPLGHRIAADEIAKAIHALERKSHD
jgi:hypothetical protein